MRTSIERFISRLIKMPVDKATRVYIRDYMKSEGFTEKQVDNLILRSSRKGYLVSTKEKIGNHVVYSIVKREKYVTRAKGTPKLSVSIDTIKSVPVQSVTSHMSNSHIDIVVTMNIKDILKAYAEKL